MMMLVVPEPVTEPNMTKQEQALSLQPELYQELKQIAHGRLRGFGAGITLNCTALVHETYLKLSRSDETLRGFKDPDHFLAVASVAMRQILVDYARGKRAEKRGSGVLHVTLQESSQGTPPPDVDILALNEALQRLGREAPQLEQLVVLRFFAGLNVDQTARVLGRSTRSTERDWVRARAYLFRELSLDGEG